MEIDQAAEFGRELAAGLNARQSIHDTLVRLLQADKGRAIGYWTWAEDEQALLLEAFAAVDDMPAEVQRDFAEQTRQVPVSETGLGIVEAVIAGKPAWANIDPSATGLGASASWLAKFEATQSLAIPILVEGQLRGVLAISSANSMSADAHGGKLLLATADHLAEHLK